MAAQSSSVSSHYVLRDANSTHQAGRQLGEQLAAGAVLLLQGDLGAGKTTLIQGLGAGLGIAESIDSPTFTLVNEYLDGRVPLYHLDLYRLNGAEVADLFLETYWEGAEVEPGIVAIEWAERLVHRPEEYLWVELTQREAGGRSLAITAIGTASLPPLHLDEPGA